MRKSVLFVTVALGCSLFGSLLIAAEDMCVPMGNITLEPLAKVSKRSEVTFPHAVHFSYDCQSCHHNWSAKEPVVGCTTSGCHDLTAMPKTEDGKPTKDAELRIRYYKKAYHDMCIGCHKSIKQENKRMEAAKTALDQKLAPVGPTSCNACHPKE